MNIALVSREFTPFYGGGIGTYTEQAAFALAAAGHRVVVLTISDDGSAGRGPLEGDPRVTVVRVPLVLGTDWSRPAPAIDTARNRAAFDQLGPWSVFSRQVAETLPDLVREFSIDVVEAPECGGILWWTLNRRRLGLRTLLNAEGREPLMVVQLHSPNEWIDEYNREAPPRRSSYELRRAERESAQWADLVIAPSRDLGLWAGERWGIPKIETVPYPLGRISVGAEPHGSEFGAAHERPCSEGTLRCLFVGRMEPRKGVDIALRALVIALRRGADVRMDFAGQDTRDWRTGAWFGRRSLRAIVPQELVSRVGFLGKLDSGALARARAEADLCIAPGVVDNFPYAAMESMAAGLPVVAPGVGGMSELVRDGVEGHIFAPSDAGAFASSLLAHAALSRGERARMSCASRARVAEYCSNQRAVAVRESVFRESIAARGVRDVPARASVAIVGAEARALRSLVESGAADFAIGWEEDSAGSWRAFGTPGTESCAIAAPVLGSVAVRSDLLASFERECGEGREDRQALVDWLIERGARGAVDPDSSSVVDFSGLADASESSLWMHKNAFAHLAPLRIARRVHPFPWELAPCQEEIRRCSGSDRPPAGAR